MIATSDGSTATNAKKMAPGRVMRVNTRSSNLPLACLTKAWYIASVLLHVVSDFNGVESHRSIEVREENDQ